MCVSGEGSLGGDVHIIGAPTFFSEQGPARSKSGPGVELCCARLRVVQRSVEAGAHNCRCGISVDNDDISCALLSHLRQRVPLRHDQAGRQGHRQ